MVNPTTEQVEQEQAIREAKARKFYIERKADLDSLSEHESFKRLFLNGYMEEEVVRLNGMLTEGYVQKEGKRGQVMEQLVAISWFRQHLITIHSLGSQFAEEEAELQFAADEG